VGVKSSVAVGVTGVGVSGFHVGDGVDVGVRVAVGVIGVPIVGAKVGVLVGVNVAVAVGVLVGVGVGVAVSVAVSVAVEVSAGVGVSVSLCALTETGVLDATISNMMPRAIVKLANLEPCLLPIFDCIEVMTVRTKIR
jgi:hypothetical protein